MSERQARVRDIRTLPFFWIQRALIEEIKPTWQGLLAYNALAYYAQNSKVSSVGIRQMAERIGTSQDTIRKGLRDLVKRKAIRERRDIVKTVKGKRLMQPNEYTLIDLGPTQAM